MEDTEGKVEKVMTTMSKREYLQRVWWRYQRAGREHKGRILGEFCAVCGYGRKWAIKLLNRGLAAEPVRRGGAPRRYGEELVEPLKQVWRAAQQPCGKRLREALPLWLPHLKLSQRRRALLLQASAATLDRLLSPLKVSGGGQRRRGTKPGGLLKTQIPIRTSNADIDRPGYLEVDTPCDRLLASAHLGKAAKARLRSTRAKLNPFDLSRQVEQQLRAVWRANRPPAPVEPRSPCAPAGGRLR